MRPTLLWIVAATAVTSIACKKSEPPPAPPLTITPKPGGAPVPETAARPTPATVPIAQELDAKGINSDQEEQNRAALNAALRAWLMMKPDVPKDMNELVAAKLISRVPPPPPGKKWVPDARTMSVTAK